MGRTLRLVGTFLSAYLLKVVLLGQENVASWDPGAILTLRLHESVIALMLLAGSTAWGLSRRIAQGEGGRLAALHRWSGRTALAAAVAAILTATLVLAAMFRLARG